MKRVITLLILILVAAVPTQAEEYYYGVEIAGIVCGYSRVQTSELEVNGQNNISFETDDQGNVTSMIFHSISRFAREE